MFLLILFFLLSIIFSFLCSIWEAVLLSITPAYASRKLQEGSPTGKLIEEYKKDIDRPLSAILTLNTIAHTVGAIGVGAQAGNLYGSTELALGPIHINGEAIVATLMTMAILILSEIIPKTIGANKWQSLAPFTVKSLKFILMVLAPFVWISQLITKKLKKDKKSSVLSRADFAALTTVGEQSGALAQQETTIIKNLLRLEKILVKDVMTPRAVMQVVDQKLTVEEYYKTYVSLRFSRIPVFEETNDNISGVVLKDEILKQLVEDKDDTTLKAISRPIQAVRDDMSLHDLFDTFTNQRVHLAIVVDQYGSTVGLVTMEDLFETLIGMEIIDESDIDIDLQQLARQKWEERARKMGLIE